jgi:hypothetical protein
MLNLPLYNPDISLVAIGPGSWKGLLFGIKQGVETIKMEQIESNPELKSEEPQAITEPNSVPKKEEPVSESQILIEDFPIKFQDSGIMKLPTIAFIPSKNLTGFTYVPRRMLKYFHEREDAAEAANGAMQVIMELKRRYEPTDLEFGKEDFRKTEVHEDEMERFQRVESFDNMGPVGEFLEIYN